jgi:hypothetical protein
MLEHFENHKSKLRRRNTGTKLATAHFLQSVKGSAIPNLFHASIEARGPVAEALAIRMMWTPQFVGIINAERDTVRFTTGERPSDHTVYLKVELDLPGWVASRDLVLVHTWEKIGEGKFILSQSSCEHPAFPPTKDRITMHFNRVWLYTEINPGLTRIDVVGTVDNLGGSIPKFVQNAIVLPAFVADSITTSIFFFCVRPTSRWQDDDAIELGRSMFVDIYDLRNKEDDMRKLLKQTFSYVTLLREAQAEHEFLEDLFLHIIRNKFSKFGSTAVSQSPLESLTAAEAKQMGTAFKVMLLANLTGAAAADELIRSAPSLGELDTKFGWFRPVLVAIADELMAIVAWGVKARAFFGATVSLADMMSDALMVRKFTLLGDHANARALLAMMATTMAFQLIITLVNTKALGLRRFLFEAAFVVTGCKSGLDAYKVASGAKQEPGAIFDPLTEMVHTRGQELVFEALPGSALQAVAFLSGSRTNTAAVSLLISICSAAFTSAMIFYEYVPPRPISRDVPENPNH